MPLQWDLTQDEWDEINAKTIVTTENGRIIGAPPLPLTLQHWLEAFRRELQDRQST